MRHRIISIGWLGCKTVFLDMTKKQAIARYAELNDVTEEYVKEELPIDVAEFDDHFYAYSVCFVEFEDNI